MYKNDEAELFQSKDVVTFQHQPDQIKRKIENVLSLFDCIVVWNDTRVNNFVAFLLCI